jgi:hypothetical protein
MHALSFHRRRLHRIVWLVLAGWVFALASSVAHACLSAPPPGQRGGLERPLSAGVAAHEVHEPDVERRASEALDSSITQASHEGYPASDSCLKFCDDEATALSKSLSASTELPASSTATLVHWPPLIRSGLAAVRWSGWQTAVQDPPLVIRFLRLTL